MKKYFKYIAVAIISTLLFTIKVEADTVDDSWIFRCDYKLTLLPNQKLRSLQVYIYDDLNRDETHIVHGFAGAKFYLSGLGSNEPTEIPLSEDYYIFKNDDKMESKISVDKDFYTNATAGNVYKCPAITISNYDSTSFGKTYSKHALSFGTETVDKMANDAKLVTFADGGNININPNLSEQEKTKIAAKALTIVKECDLNLQYNSGLPRFYLRQLSDGSMQVGFKLLDTITIEHNKEPFDWHILQAFGFDTIETKSYEMADIPVKNYTKTQDADIATINRLYRFRKDDYDLFNNILSSNCATNERIVVGYAGKEQSKGIFIISNSDYIEKMGYDIVGYTSAIRVFDKYVDTCKNMLGTKLVGYLQTGYTIIKIASIVIVIVMAMLDFAKNVLNGKEEALKIAMKWGKRLVIVIIILLLPTFIDLIGSLFGYPDIACGIK